MWLLKSNWKYLSSSFSLVKIYISGDMELSISKFVIQWRKFESKRSSRNAVMNLSRLTLFLDFFRYK